MIVFLKKRWVELFFGSFIALFILAGMLWAILVWWANDQESRMWNMQYVRSKMGIHREVLREYILNYHKCPETFDILASVMESKYKEIAKRREGLYWFNHVELLENNDAIQDVGNPYVIISVKNLCCLISKGPNKQMEENTVKEETLFKRFQQYPSPLRGENGVWVESGWSDYSIPDDFGTCLLIYNTQMSE